MFLARRSMPMRCASVLADPQARGGEPYLRRMARGRLRRGRRRHRGGPHYEGRRCSGGNAVAVDAGLRASWGTEADPRLRGHARGRHGRIRQKLAARMMTDLVLQTCHSDRISEIALLSRERASIIV